MTGKYQAYPEYKDSGIAWLGDLPTHWKVKKLKYLIKNLNSGVSVNAESVPANRDEIGVLKTSCVYTKVFRAKENKKVIEEELGRVSCRVTKGQLIISRMNTPELVGACAPVLQKYNNLYLPDRLWQTEFYSVGDHDAHYVHSVSLLQGFRDQIKIVATGTSSSMQNIAKEDFLGIYIPHPPIHEKQNIRQFLDHETAKIDTLIEEQQSLIRLLIEKRQAVISHAVTKGLNPDAPMKDSGVEWLGEVPEHWVVRRLKHVADLQSGIPKGKDLTGKTTIRVPMLRVANVQDGYLKLDEVHKIKIEPEQLERYLLQKGDVLMNEGGDNDKLGRGAVWNCEIEPCIHQNHVFAIRPKTIEPEWLELLTGSSYAKFHFYRVSKQSTNLASISSSNIKETPLVIPPADERTSIMSYLKNKMNKYDSLEAECHQQVKLLNEHRTALISAAVTGKIDVRNWVTPTTAPENSASHSGTSTIPVSRQE